MKNNLYAYVVADENYLQRVPQSREAQKVKSTRSIFLSKKNKKKKHSCKRTRALNDEGKEQIVREQVAARITRERDQIWRQCEAAWRLGGQLFPRAAA